MTELFLKQNVSREQVFPEVLFGVRKKKVSFQRDIDVSDGRIGWLESEIDEWIANRQSVT